MHKSINKVFMSMPNQQRGMALYVALIMLLLLTLLGLAAMQVSTMQERMAGNFNTLNMAFQNGELEARANEYAIQQALNANTPFNQLCAIDDVGAWASQRSPGDGAQRCALRVSAASAATGGSLVSSGSADEVNTLTDYYRVVAAGVDRGQNASTVIVVETIFIPK